MKRVLALGRWLGISLAVAVAGLGAVQGILELARSLP